jgi:phospholipase/lecithinase/hemolysin
MLQRSRSALLATLLLAAFAPTARAGYITEIVTFGDSLSDTGNLFAATGGFPPPPYAGGRSSNGPVWLEYLAARLGVKAPTPSQTGGTNYAWAFADSGSGTSPVPGAPGGAAVPNVGAQVDQYLATHTLNPTQLVTLWAGPNDFFDGQLDPTVPVANLADAITDLAGAGGKIFLVPNMPHLDRVPYAQTLTPDQRAGLAALTQAYNTALATRLGQLETALGVTIHHVDVAGLLARAQANPGAHGFTNVTDSAVAAGAYSGEGYLFWDHVHPTTAAHAMIGEAAYLAATPEPSSFALLATAAVGGLAWSRRRKAA